MDKNEIREILEQHRLWINLNGGKRIDLCSVDLRGADLRGANAKDVVIINVLLF